VDEEGYTWEQTSGGGDSEITISFKMEKAVAKKDIKVPIPFPSLLRGRKGETQKWIVTIDRLAT